MFSHPGTPSIPAETCPTTGQADLGVGGTGAGGGGGGGGGRLGGGGGERRERKTDRQKERIKFHSS